MGGWLEGWMGGLRIAYSNKKVVWVSGWLGAGCKSRFKDCLQQSKKVLEFLRFY